MNGFLLCAAMVLSCAAPVVAAGLERPPVVVTYQDDVATLDPAIGYDWQNWSLIRSLFDGLMDYEPGTTNLRPALAKSYEVDREGLTYTFYLHQGVRFHNGRLLEAEDVVWSLNRVVHPATRSPAQGFFSMIAGYEEAAAGRAPLAGVTAPDPQTVVIRLSRPDATFLHIMALNFAAVVPREVVEAAGADFGFAPVGTGALRLKEWRRGERLEFEANPDYFRPGIPRIPALVIEIGVSPVAALERARQGKVDMLGDGIPSTRFVEVMTDPDLAPRVIEGGQLHTGYITLNVKLAPFDKPEVRKAVNMAINKDRIIAVIHGRAVPAQQILPPLMPGYITDFPGYPFDVKAAERLMARVGLSGGFETELYISDVDPNQRIAEVIRQDLRAIGIKVEIRALPRAELLALAGAGRAPMVWSGGLGWISDFPDPSNFYAPILSCAAAQEGGWNWARFCRPDLDAEAVRADTMASASQREDRTRLWSRIYREVMEEAPWVPVFHEQRFNLISARMVGDPRIYVDPVFAPVNYPYIEVRD